MVQAPASIKRTSKTRVQTTPTVVSKTSKINNKPFTHGTGRRKSAVARVLLRKGNGQIIVNGRSFDEYFTVLTAVDACQASFRAYQVTSGIMADVKVSGGGYSAQAVAVQLGIARALLAFDETLKSDLRNQGFITVDSRVKERKKYGQKAARRKFQFTKR